MNARKRRSGAMMQMRGGREVLWDGREVLWEILRDTCVAVERVGEEERPLRDLLRGFGS